MKKITILMIAMCATVGAYAQFNQGRMLVGGSLAFQSVTSKYKFDGQTTTEGKSTDFSIAPQFGYFVIDNLAVGATLDVTLSKWKDDDGDYESTATILEFQPTVRYYLPMGVFFQGQFGIGTGKYKDDEDGNVDEEKFTRTSFAGAVGYAIFLNDNIAIEPMIGYGSSGDKYKDADYKDINNGLFVRVGIQAYLGNK
ncbi:outer membrane beta-barrel protein [Chryseolinea sp. H1M3-3]|uniref:outer membrane beta-barrel protein n=1 Tax=Chryseolinea sp. H1M3-3 TaxID=3034144 RepID=UPI0023EC3C4D|nr:outer membrane beta-barrel protein [Chryseolinea sp. H1M3-3]